MRTMMMTAAACAIGLGACSQSTPAPAQTAPGQSAPVQAMEPSPTMSETFGGCRWGRVESATMAVWSYDCPADKGGMKLVADESLPGFAIESSGDGETTRQAAIIAFKKTADAPVTSILAAVRAKSPGPNTATCELTPANGQTPDSGPAFILTPTGAVKTAWDRQDAGDGSGEPMDAPCGPLGVQMSGDRSFSVLKGDPTTVVFIEYGSEIQIFDAATLTSKTAG